LSRTLHLVAIGLLVAEQPLAEEIAITAIITRIISIRGALWSATELVVPAMYKSKSGA